MLQAFRVLVDNSFTPSHNPVELHFASAEEGGLLGSQAVAQSYAKEGKKVRAMLQCDMTSVVKEGTKPTIGLIRDFVDPEWTEHLARIITEYSEIGYTNTECGYVSSGLRLPTYSPQTDADAAFLPLGDPSPFNRPALTTYVSHLSSPPLLYHIYLPSFFSQASWTKIGAPSAFTIESTFADSSKAIHSSSDTITQPGFSFEHMAQFTRVAIAVAVELGGGEGLKKLRA